MELRHSTGRRPPLSDIITVPHKKDSKTEYGKYHHISLVLHAGKVLTNVVARNLSKNSEAKGLLTEEQCGFRPDRSTTDMMFVVRTAGDWTEGRAVPLHVRHRSPEGIRHRCSYSLVAGTYS